MVLLLGLFGKILARSVNNIWSVVVQQPTHVSKEDLIYTIICAIPEGKVASYGQVAKLAGYPNNSRLVGRLLKLMPEGSSIPWHRVVNSQGKISFPEGSCKHLEQRQKLLSEGVTFNKTKINMRLHQWD
ncbi:MAG: cysteine methyltransferase [Pseudoalteromonas sp.]|nr:cysteine methyltransferase [Pseudoalteromonas sp.]